MCVHTDTFNGNSNGNVATRTSRHFCGLCATRGRNKRPATVNHLPIFFLFFFFLYIFPVSFKLCAVFVDVLLFFLLRTGLSKSIHKYAFTQLREISDTFFASLLLLLEHR